MDNPSPCCPIGYILTMAEQKVICGDSLEIMKTFPDKSFDLVLTDPPYGIGASSKKFINGTSATRKDYYEDVDWDTDIPRREYFEEMFRVSRNQIIWGGNYFIAYLHATRCFFVWDKTIHGNSYADCEMAWTSFDANARIKRLNMVATNMDGRQHPTQKPVELMRWCLDKYSEEGQKILDPFGGSGTTAVSAKYLNRNCTLIEISEKYCEIARNRLSQQQLF